MKELFINLKKIWKYAKSEKNRILIYTFLSVFYIFISVIYPFMSAKLIVELTNNNIHQFIYISIVLVSVYIFEDLINFFRNKIYEKVFMNIYINIQYSLGSEILKLSNKELDQKGSGVFIQRLLGDTRVISTIFTDLSRYINGILSNIGVIITYFVLSKPVFIFVVISFIIRLLIEIKRINVYTNNNKEFKKNYDKLTGFTGEIVRGASDIKMLNGENSFLRELKNKFSDLYIERYNMQSTNINFNSIRAIWSDLSFLIMMVIIGVSIMNGSLSVAIGVVIYNFGNSYNGFVHNITGFHELIKDFNLSAGRIFDIFDKDKFKKESFGKRHLDSVKGNFEFKDVSFKYTNNLVLNNISFNVKSNETVAFVGKSGAGKTTIFNLLSKLYDGYDGNIYIDGVDIKELDKDSIRGNITIVSQNPYLFNMSIKDNLRLIKKDITDKEIKEACKMACLDEFIESLDNKYDTIIGEGGVNLSGGQKQRLAIARAFVQKTKIILFDEATSALDNETQSKIQQAIDNLQKDYTILIIAHRLSTIKNADRILFIENGKIIAEGNHDTLIKTCREYKELYNTELIKE